MFENLRISVSVPYAMSGLVSLEVKLSDVEGGARW
jgi:hypothetical protein